MGNPPFEYFVWQSSLTLQMPYLDLLAHPQFTDLMILARTLERGQRDGEYMASQRK